MNLFILGAHPDDPESGCGGLAARCMQAGHDVAFVYGTAFRPERRYFGRTEREVRTGEALEACAVLGVRGVIWTGRQSMHFHATHYVDISDVAELKHRALLCHRSQDGEAVWQDHEVMHRFRGRECGVERAEAYIRVDRRGTTAINLPGLAV